MSDLSNLIEWLEKATGPDQALDLMIAEAIGHKTYQGTTPVIAAAPAYTASLDEAVALVPEGEHWCVGRNDLDADEIEKKNLFVAHVIEWREAKTPAIALCIAALKAREARG